MVKGLPYKDKMYLNPYTNTWMSKRSVTNFLNKRKLSKLDIILEYNKVSKNDIPLCTICSKKHDRVFEGNLSRVSYGKVKIHGHCSDVSCTNSFYSKIHSTRGVQTRIASGTHGRQNLTKDENSIVGKKTAKTQLDKGNHPFLNQSDDTILKKISHSQMIIEIINGTEYKFRSKAESRVFKKYFKYLNNLFESEKVVCKYTFNNKSRRYIADYVNFNKKFIVEVKSGDGNFNKSMRGIDHTLDNYQKFKSCINSGFSILIINNYRNGKEFIEKRYYIKTICQLDLIFKKWM